VSSIVRPQRFIEPVFPGAAKDFAPVVAVALSISVVYIPQYFRVIRNHVVSVKEEPFVEAARAIGAKPRVIMGRYIFFNVVQSVPVILTLNAADAILTLASLGFLGYGLPPPTPEWGYNLSRSASEILLDPPYWWTSVFPGLMIVTLVLGITLLGEGINDIWNPLLREKGR
jgi:peptide/nickel transport system permease protein